MPANNLRRLRSAQVALKKRQLADNPIDSQGGIVQDVPSGGGDPSGNDFTFTGPFTLTIIETSLAGPTPSTMVSTPVMTSSASESTETTSSSPVPPVDVVSTTDPLSSSSSPASSSSTAYTTSVIAPTSSLSSAPTSSALSTGTDESSALGANSFQSRKLSTPVLAGIIIGCIVVALATVMVIARFISKRKRLRSRGQWLRSPLNPPSAFEPRPFYAGTDSVPATFSSQFYETPQISEGSQHQRPVSIPSSVIAPPSASYNNSDSFSTSHVTMSNSRSPGAFTSSVYGSSSASLSPFDAKVVYSFITKLPDELSLQVGEVIRVLAEYDDGWALGMNANGEQGMIPLECLQRDGNLSQQQQDWEGTRNKRISSLGPTAQPWRGYR